MEDAFNITRYDRTDAELESFLLFAIAVAGKNAVQTDLAFEKLWSKLRSHGLALVGSTPFAAIRNAVDLGLLDAEILRQCGFGCYNHRFRSFLAAANSGLNLRTCTPEDLEKIPGIGRKTSRFYVLHSRKGARCAALDTHILKYLRDVGIQNVPKSTPSSAKEYARLEAAFLDWFDSIKAPGETVAEFDLSIWRLYTKNKEAA